jgi:hypothetical protein
LFPLTELVVKYEVVEKHQLIKVISDPRIRRNAAQLLTNQLFAVVASGTCPMEAYASDTDPWLTASRARCGKSWSWISIG